MSCMKGNRELFWSQYRGIGLNQVLIWVTPKYFTFPRRHLCSSSLVRDFWGTLYNSFKQIKAPELFDWEPGIALYAMQGNRGSSPSEGLSHGISRFAAGTWGIFPSYSGDGLLKLHFVQRSHDSCLVTTDTSEI